MAWSNTLLKAGMFLGVVAFTVSASVIVKDKYASKQLNLTGTAEANQNIVSPTLYPTTKVLGATTAPPISPTTTVLPTKNEAKFSPPSSNVDISQVKIGGWIPGSDFQAGLETVTERRLQVYQAHLAAASVVESGEISYSSSMDQMVKNLNDGEIKFGLNVISSNFNGSSNFLKDRAKRQPLYDKLLSMKQTSKYFESWNINFENMHLPEKDAYFTFLKEAKEFSSANGLTLYVTVFAKFDKDPNMFETKTIHDYKAISQYADYIIVMGYDYPMTNGKNTEQYEPNSPNPWLDDVLNYSVRQVPPQKLILGLPLYGYGFNTKSKTTQIKSAYTYNQIKNIIKINDTSPLYDEKTGEMYIIRGNERIIYDNKDTLDTKKRIALKYGVDKVFYWRFGRDEGIGFHDQ